jgi:hypothetical protein
MFGRRDTRQAKGDRWVLVPRLLRGAVAGGQAGCDRSRKTVQARTEGVDVNTTTMQTIRKSMLAWFKEHRPDTPGVQVKTGVDETGPWVQTTWAWCEGQCHLMPTRKDFEAAFEQAVKEAGYEGELRCLWGMRNMRMRFVHSHCDESSANPPT